MSKYLQMSAIEIHDLMVAYNQKPVLWGIDALIPQGQITGIIGPNGAGKSTLLQAMMGLIPLQSGFVKFYGQELSANLNKVSYIPQREKIDWDFPIQVKDVVKMGRYGRLGLFKKVTSVDREIIDESLSQVGMQAYRNRQIGELSGGQQQRVFLARALAQQADIYLMDEPFAGIDAATEAKLMEIINSMKVAGKTIIIVHHDLFSATKYFDWALLLNLRLIASGPSTEVFAPELIEKTYGGKLPILEEIRERWKAEHYSPKG